MGDEGVGVHVVRRLETMPLPDGVTLLDGGTGGLHLLSALQQARHVVLVDATIDGAPPGTVRRLCPRFSHEYPRSLTAHDIGLKDLLDALYLLGAEPDITLFAISIGAVDDLGTELSEPVAACMDDVAKQVLAEARAAVGPSSADAG
jgi:hydrogenase maturation protease